MLRKRKYNIIGKSNNMLKRFTPKDKSLFFTDQLSGIYINKVGRSVFTANIILLMEKQINSIIKICWQFYSQWPVFGKWQESLHTHIATCARKSQRPWWLKAKQHYCYKNNTLRSDKKQQGCRNKVQIVSTQNYIKYTEVTEWKHKG